MTCRFASLALLVLVTAWSPKMEAGPFEQGRVRVALGGGSGGSFGNRYFVISYGVGYFVLDGWEIGIDAEHWFGEDPSLHKLSEQTRYVFHMVPMFKPYIGAFHKHWFIGDDIDDIDTIGGRLGGFFVVGGHFFLGGGVVHEIIVSDCDMDCSETYPEFVFSATF